MFEYIVKKGLFNKLRHINYGQLSIKVPDGSLHQFRGKFPGVLADISLKNWSVVINAVSKGDVGLAEDYGEHYWYSTNIENLLLFALQNEKVFNQFGHGSFIFKQLTKLLYFTRRNTIRKSRSNIQTHYDLGNDFYKIWLDKTLTYSAAIFKNEHESLETAQYNKYNRLLDKIDTSNAKILEIGCGWGGFATLANLRGHKVKGITLSQNQYAYAKAKTEHLGVNIALEDYRHQYGKYDVIVSIEMLEAVGEKYWETYFNKLYNLIKDDGKILIQVITINDKLFNKYRKSADMIRTFIFPGGMLPCENALKKIITRANLKITDIFRFGKDYAKTLRIWLNSFNKDYDQVKALGFDEKFIRLWSFYLALCIAGFENGRINVIQLELTKINMGELV